MKIVIIDYGMGNIFSLTGALNYIGINPVISNNANDIRNADKLFLPGVGAFNQAMNNIRNLHLDTLLYTAVIENKKPILGICLGMQLMGHSSTENQFSTGLKFINGITTKINHPSVKIPHVGFNQVITNRNSRLFYNIESLSDFYFTHSFKMESTDNINPFFCEYGNQFVVGYEKDNIAGVQFHPELSQTNGLQLLKNFV